MAYFEVTGGGLFWVTDDNVSSFAVLMDDNENWHPKEYVRELLDFRIRVEFPSVKLLNFKKDWDALERSDNPFAVLVIAHLKTQETQRDYNARMISKLEVLRMMGEKGYREPRGRGGDDVSRPNAGARG